MDTKNLINDLRNGRTKDLRNRRLLSVLSLIGISALSPVVLLQMGIIRHLPDPPLEGFNSDKVNLSETAYGKGTPDGTVAITFLAANLIFAGIGGKTRAEKEPWVPIATSVKGLMGAGMAGMLFYKMGWKIKAWCGYCITAAIVNAGIFLLSLPELKRVNESYKGHSLLKPSSFNELFS
jgi:uncharacterized membrane protein